MQRRRFDPCRDCRPIGWDRAEGPLGVLLTGGVGDAAVDEGDGVPHHVRLPVGAAPSAQGGGGSSATVVTNPTVALKDCFRMGDIVNRQANGVGLASGGGGEPTAAAGPANDVR